MRSSLLTGLLGFQPRPVTAEAIGYLVYAIPVAIYVLWPSGLRLRRRQAAANPAGRAHGMTVRTAILASTVVAAGLALAGCGGEQQQRHDHGRRLGASAAASRSVDVKLVDAGCEPAELRLAAGPVTFEVANDGADAISEFEILDGDRILGEVENLPPGLSGHFSLTLKPGRYTMYCPGGSSAERGPLVVSGKASGTSAAAAAAVAQYRRYVEGQTALLVTRTRRFVQELEAGDLEGAKTVYAAARAPYERIEPVAESFGNLDPAIDARAGDVPKAKWTGFHPIEQYLWVRGATGPKELRTKLMDDVLDLQRRVQTIELEPAQVANGSVELLGEVSKSKITGEEERYSHIDLVDFEANVQGAEGCVPVGSRPGRGRAACAREGDRRSLRGRRHGARAIPPRHRLRRLHGADEGRHARPEPLDRRARGATLRGGGGRRGAMSRRLTRGRLLAAGAVGAGVALGGVGVERLAAGGDGDNAAEPIPFHGERQAGITTPAQDRLHFAAFDVVTTLEVRAARPDAPVDRGGRRGCPRGEPVGETGQRLAPPIDTGEAVGLSPARLTVTFGFGPTLFDRFGLERSRPAALAELPVFAGDELDPERSGGDIAVQACADDPQVAFHAVRNLARIGRGAVVMRWSQLGFGRTSSTSRAQETPRNLMGFKDGTNNIKLEDSRALAEHVWVAGELRSALAARRHLHGHAPHPHADRGLGPGEPRRSGADDRPPQGERRSVRPGGRVRPRQPLADARRRAHPPGGAERERRSPHPPPRLLVHRRDGRRARPARRGALLHQLPERPGEPSSSCSGAWRASDALNEYIKHTGSALFACPPGVRPGGYVGETLLG